MPLFAALVSGTPATVTIDDDNLAIHHNPPAAAPRHVDFGLLLDNSTSMKGSDPSGVSRIEARTGWPLKPQIGPRRCRQRGISNWNAIYTDLFTNQTFDASCSCRDNSPLRPSPRSRQAGRTGSR